MTAPQPPNGPPRPGGYPPVPPAQRPQPGPPAGAAPAGAAPGPPSRRRGGVAIVVAFAAVLIALAAAGLAALALHRANDAIAAPQGPAAGSAPPTATGSPAPDPTTASAGTADPASTDLPPIDTEAEFRVVYQDIPLTVQVNDFGTRNIDLDQPSVDSGPDVVLNGMDGNRSAITMDLSDGVTAAAAENTAVTPKECLSRIQLAALDTNSAVPLRKGQAFCVLTSLGDAQSRGDTQKLVVIGISGISDDRQVSITATAYAVPR